jgi:5'-deoxynucleotidase YfbR-like HD superfamily hydrolase
MATLHDLPEALTTDIPTLAWRHLPSGSKLEVERALMEHMAAQSHPDWLVIWEDLQAAESAEARLVHDADKIDLYLQALIYEEQSGNLRLAEFWENIPTFHYSLALRLYERLRDRRASLRSP